MTNEYVSKLESVKSRDTECEDIPGAKADYTVTLISKDGLSTRTASLSYEAACEYDNFAEAFREAADEGLI